MIEDISFPTNQSVVFLAPKSVHSLFSVPLTLQLKRLPMVVKDDSTSHYCFRSFTSQYRRRVSPSNEAIRHEKREKELCRVPNDSNAFSGTWFLSHGVTSSLATFGSHEMLRRHGKLSVRSSTGDFSRRDLIHSCIHSQFRHSDPWQENQPYMPGLRRLKSEYLEVSSPERFSSSAFGSPNRKNMGTCSTFDRAEFPHARFGAVVCQWKQNRCHLRYIQETGV